MKKNILLSIFLVLCLTITTTGHTTEPIKPLPQSFFHPITSFNPVIRETTLHRKIKIIPVPIVEPTAKIIIKVKPVFQPPKTSHSIYGKASWYCKAGVSICHHSYPPGSMVAAACYKLRSAFGSHWRGRRVTVTYHSRVVIVRLVDWCGSRDKLIDLYWEPMRRLGGSGVLSVKVAW